MSIMAQVVRERRTEERIRAKDAADIVEEIHGMEDEVASLRESLDELLEALEEVAKAEGAYNRDPLTHAENVIENMVAVAQAAIAKAKGATP